MSIIHQQQRRRRRRVCQASFGVGSSGPIVTTPLLWWMLFVVCEVSHAFVFLNTRCNNKNHHNGRIHIPKVVDVSLKTTPTVVVTDHDDDLNQVVVVVPQQGVVDNNNNNNSKNLSNQKFNSMSQLNELKESIDIVSAIESYGLQKFQRKGGHMAAAATAVCPFHNDNTPSLHIDGKRNIFKCFACGAGGDIFKFVREYNQLQGVEMTFYQAVRDVSSRFGNGQLFSFDTDSYRYNYHDPTNNNKAKRDAILLANAAAALFYSDNLVTLPAAGKARTHLRSRGLSPLTVKTFALGYAPDSYYFRQKQQQQRKSAGGSTSSLVDHLRTLGFSATDIVEAGLAIRTDNSKDNDEVLKEDLTSNATTTTSNATAAASSLIESETDIVDIDPFLGLMDRFRGRLMVPIFDANGEHVLGFGGRILTTPEEEQNSKFKPPKYLNSPESVAFLKKLILFGQSTAKEAIRGLPPLDRRTVVIVEGYMDAISLWDAGVGEVVASMGTALSSEQLVAASKLVGKHGKIILCLDADAAGVAAVERLCSSNVLQTTAELTEVNIHVASLPEGIKDPAEFVESNSATNKKKEQIGQAFRETVLARADEWTLWYIQRILSSIHSSDVRSFGQSFERVAEFLSTFPNPAERIQRASNVALMFAQAMAANSDTTTVSSAVRMQYEADLIDMVSRKAAAKDSLKRRIDTVSYSGNVSAVIPLSTLSGGLTNDEQGGKLSSKALGSVRREGEVLLNSSKTRQVRVFREASRKPRRTSVEKKTRTTTRAKDKLILTPHFTGFRFNPSDKAWLNLEDRKQRSTPVSSDDGQYSKDPVYFNSNVYHGQQLLTSAAENSGYTRTATQRDLSVFENGVSSLIKPDPDTMVSAAEDKLLRTLVTSQRARLVMKHLLEAKSTAGTDVQFTWTCPERQWLFLRLINDIADGLSVKDLRTYLSKLPDAPVGAFQNRNEDAETDENESSETVSVSKLTQSLRSVDELLENVFDPTSDDEMIQFLDDDLPADVARKLAFESDSVDNDKIVVVAQQDGTLDCLFAVNEDLPGPAENEIADRIDVCVQESFASLLAATAMKKLHDTLHTAMALPFGAQEATSQTQEESSTDVENNKKDVGVTSLAAAVRDAAMNVHKLRGSADRAAPKILSFSNSEGHAAWARRKELERNLRDILDGNLGNNSPDDNDNFYDESSSSTETVEEALARIDSEWGEMAHDDYEWSQESVALASYQLSRRSKLLSSMGPDNDDDDESLDDFNARIDQEYESFFQSEATT